MANDSRPRELHISIFKTPSGFDVAYDMDKSSHEMLFPTGLKDFDHVPFILVERSRLDAALAERENALELAHERKIKLMERNLELLKLSSERDQAVADAKAMAYALGSIGGQARRETNGKEMYESDTYGFILKCVLAALTPELRERYGV